MKPPYRLKEWHTGKTLDPMSGFHTQLEAMAAATAMGHGHKLAGSGPFYTPRAYVVDGNGDYVSAPVFLRLPPVPIMGPHCVAYIGTVPNDDKEEA